jgi:hypothetical protein
LAAVGVSVTSAFLPVSYPTSVAPGTSFSTRGNCLRSMATEDCGCDDIVMAGKPTPKARALNAREVVSNFSVRNAMGDEVRMDELLSATSGVTIVVFLRSLG